MSVQKKKIDVQRAGKFVLFLLMVHFLFFGYLCNIYLREDADVKVIYTYLSFFDKSAWLSLFIFIIIFTLQAFSNELLADAIKLNLIMLVFVFLSAMFWHGYITESFVQPFTALLSFHTIINFVVLLILSVGCSLLGGYLKSSYRNYLVTKRGVEL